MEYAAYRARGLPIGSGSVESGCKQLVSARLKGAGMIWDASGAEEVAVVRAWLKSGRWEEAMGLRKAPGRGYVRQECVSKRAADVRPAEVPGARAGGLPSEVLAQVREEMAQERQRHPWKRPWSRKQQQAQHEDRAGHPRPVAAA